MTLFIIGYMACGKTTFGKALARAMGREFIDLDFYIEQRFRMSVSEIFAQKGEAEFRRIESNVLKEVGEFQDVIISCGGGTPCFYDNIEWMNLHGTTVWLNTPTERIVERLIANSSRRPLMAGKTPDEIRDTVGAGLSARLPYYSQARIHFSGRELENRTQIANTVTTFLKTFNFD